MNPSQIQTEIIKIQEEIESWDIEKILQWTFDRFDSRVAVASSFGAEDVVLIEAAAKVRPKCRVFTLDTDFLFPETYALIEQIEQRYEIVVERCKSVLTPADQAQQFGEALWTQNPNQCCQLRKVDPLQAKLKELDAWITGIRRDQSPARAHARKVEWDSRFSLVKVNPLADWTWEKVWEYIGTYQVPYNPLHDQNYPSIGCVYCTRPVQPGEDLRAGRWSGFAKTECGLHAKE